MAVTTIGRVLTVELQNTLVGVAGRKGSGKSTMMRRILERCSRLFLFDPMGEHGWVPNRFNDWQDADEFLAWAQTQKLFAGSYIPQGSLEQDFDWLADIIYDQGNLVFGVEEVPMLCSPSYLPSSFDRIVRLGRHRRVSVVWTAQRMAEVARRLTAATDYFVLFGHTEPRDLDAIAERCGSDVADKVMGLSLHGYLVWDVINRCARDLEDLGEELAEAST